jgi:WD40 repeat protein
LAVADRQHRIFVVTLVDRTHRALVGHQGSIRRIAFSPDSRHLASASDDATGRLWDLASGQSIVLAGHQGKVMDVAFSPSGLLLATASADKTLRLWNLEGGPVRILRGNTSHVYSTAFSRDGNTIASGGLDHTARLWRLDDPLRVTSMAEFGAWLDARTTAQLPSYEDW